VTAPAPTTIGRKRRRRQDNAGYLFLLPWFVGILFTVGPFLVSLYLAFSDYNLINPPKWSGTKNFETMLHDSSLHQSLKVTFIYVIVSVPLSLAAALGVAMVLHKGIRGLAIYRSVYYLPSLLGGSVAIVMMWKYIFGTDGVVNDALAWIGITGPAWTSDPDYALTTLIILHIWTFGSPMIIFLAGLKQIPTMYYEAAQMDGASAARQFRSVTLPLLSPIIFFNLVQSLIASFQTFTQGFVFSGGTGGPASSTLFYNVYLYQKGFAQFDMGYASALAWLLLVIIAIFTAINFLGARFWVFYDN
jgi:multiple sugar transport system permease protein